MRTLALISPLLFAGLMGCFSAESTRDDPPLNSRATPVATSRSDATKEFAELAGLQVDLRDWRRLDVDIKGPSAIAYHPQRKTIFVASDKGYLLELSGDFRIVNRFSIEGDLEGLTVDAASGHLLLASERENALLEFDIDKKKVVGKFIVALNSVDAFRQKEPGNKGIEGVTQVLATGEPPLLYATVQDDPARLIELRPVEKRVSRLPQDPESRQGESRNSLEQVASWRIARVIDLDVSPLSDVCYHPPSKTLLVTSSKQKIVLQCSLEGKELRRFRVPGDKPEGLALLPDGRALIADDEGDLWISSSGPQEPE